MPGIVREGVDSHIGHASPTPGPFHQTSYVAGLNPDVYVNGQLAIVVGDNTACGDPAVQGSGDVFIHGIPVHRRGDATGGHGSWVPNAALTASTDVFANGP